MTKIDGIIDPSTADEDEMFVGWAKTPAVDRRFLLAALPFGLLGTSGASWLLSSQLDDPGAGAWLTNATHKIVGAMSVDPYRLIRIADPTSPFGMRTVLIIAQGKCTSSLDLKSKDTHSVEASGVLIQRKERNLLEVSPFIGDWLKPASTTLPAELYNPPVTSLGTATLAGTIMDSKCFLGVMRPARGKTHKACASLCIRGGIPPSFWVRSKDGRENILLMTTSDGRAMPMDILPLVADPVEATGEIVRVGDLLHFRADIEQFRRI